MFAGSWRRSRSATGLGTGPVRRGDTDRGDGERGDGQHRAIDPLGAIADICAEYGVWLHVDGAYGGPVVLLLDRYARERAALARADSIGLDPHKWLYAPVDAGLPLLRDAAPARDAFSLFPVHLGTDDDPDGVGGPVWSSEYDFEQTRPFRALKVWMLLRHLGTAGYRELIEHDLATAEQIRTAVRAAGDLELLTHGLSVVDPGATDAIVAEVLRGLIRVLPD
ncbi:pyridoxal-dependent decarboxylase [Micromonosporaceae bacterium Da 78-11]